MPAHVAIISSPNDFFTASALSSPLIIMRIFLADIIVPIPMVYACFGTCSFDSKNVDLLESFSLIKKHSVLFYKTFSWFIKTNTVPLCPNPNN